MQRFTNDVYLIERTKLLEGILCSSLTFTNSILSTDYTKTSALFQLSGNNLSDSERDRIKETILNLYQSPLARGESVNVIDALSFYDRYLAMPGGVFERYEPFLETQTVIVDGQVQEISSSYYGSTFTPKNSISIYYKIYYALPDGIIEDYIEISYLMAVVENKYPLKPYTITDCICRCLELGRPLLKGELPKYTLQGVTYSYDGNGNLVRSIAEGSQADKYDKVIAPNFTMTQCTLREQLQTIGGYIHAEPRLGYDPDGTGLNYEENTVIFDEYGKEEKTSLSEQGYVYRGITQSINDYCTEVSTNVANIVNTLNYTDGVITDPCKGLTRTLRTESVNVMLTESNAEVYTQFPIYSIDKVMCGLFIGNSGEIEPIDITPYIFESHEYNGNLSSYGGAYPYSKSYALYYTQGQKNIKGLFFKPQEGVDTFLSEYAITNILTAVTGESQKDNITDNYPYLCFQITYTPIYSSKFSHAKGRMQNGNHAFTSIYAQSENLIETSYYGENIKGVAERLGNVQETRTYVFKDASYIPRTGQILSTPNGDMVITAVTYQMFHTHVRCTVALTKEFNRISQYVGINSQKRISEVSEREAYARDILIKEYAVIGDKQTDTAKLIRNKKVLLGAFVGGDTDSPINAVVAAGTPKKYWNNEQTPIYYNGVALPVVSSAFGNAMVFSWNYKDNYSAGLQLGRSGVKNWVKDIPYCDYYGRFYWYDFSLTTRLNVTDKRAFANGAMAGVNTYGYPHKTPNAPIRTSRVEQGETKYHNPVLVRKDSREVINVHYELEFVSNRNDLIIGSASASKCTLVGTDTTRRTAKVYFFANHRFGKYPKTLAEVQEQALDTLSIGQGNLNRDFDGFSFVIPNTLDFSSWCIAYVQTTTDVIYSNEDGEETTIPTVTGGEIVLACNNDVQYYRSNGIRDENIYISTTNTNLKGV